MAAGYPVKVNYLTGDVLTAANLNDLAGTVNLYDPTAKGDLFPATAADTVSRLAVGADATVLTADSTTATGLKWAAAAAGGGSNFTLLNAGGTALTGAQNITVSGISGADKVFVYIVDASSASTSSAITMRINNTTSNYRGLGTTFISNSVSNIVIIADERIFGIHFANLSSNAASYANGSCFIRGAASAGVKIYSSSGAASTSGGSAQEAFNHQGAWSDASTVSSIVIRSSSGNFDGGQVYVYTSA